MVNGTGVLLVSDSRSLFEIINNHLKGGGQYNVDRIGSVKGALHQMSIRSYDMVLADNELVDGSGIQLLKELRQKGNKTPFLVITYSIAEAVDESRFLDVTPDGFIDVGDMDAFLVNLKNTMWALTSSSTMAKALVK
jgi:DNA-binding response OmpR family regulator